MDTCKTCRFYRPHSCGLTTETYGECHSHPPQATITPDESGFPSINEGNWCGEWEEYNETT